MSHYFTIVCKSSRVVLSFPMLPTWYLSLFAATYVMVIHASIISSLHIDESEILIDKIFVLHKTTFNLYGLQWYSMVAIGFCNCEKFNKQVCEKDFKALLHHTQNCIITFFENRCENHCPYVKLKTKSLGCRDIMTSSRQHPMILITGNSAQEHQLWTYDFGGPKF